MASGLGFDLIFLKKTEGQVSKKNAPICGKDNYGPRVK